MKSSFRVIRIPILFLLVMISSILLSSCGETSSSASESIEPQQIESSTEEKVEPTSKEEPQKEEIEIKLFTTTANLNVREGVGTSYSILYTAKEGEALVMTGNEDVSSGGSVWYEVCIPDTAETGWVSSKYGKITATNSLDHLEDNSNETEVNETEVNESEEEKQDVSKKQRFDGTQVVTFGEYEQDGNLENGPEEIRWYVISIEDSKNVLLLCKDILDVMPYNWSDDAFKATSWKSCSLRKWLNNDFYNAAFSKEEKDALVTDNNLSVKDNVWILSSGEYRSLFKDEWKTGSPYWSEANATIYAGRKMRDRIHTSSLSFWLRDNGEEPHSAMAADGGTFGGQSSQRFANGNDNGNIGVRPVIVVNPDKIK